MVVTSMYNRLSTSSTGVAVVAWSIRSRGVFGLCVFPITDCSWSLWNYVIAYRSWSCMNVGLIDEENVGRSDSAPLEGWFDESPDSLLTQVHDRPQPILYGLPCARCRCYYDAQLKACPLCRCSERVSPTTFTPPLRANPRAA